MAITAIYTASHHLFPALAQAARACDIDLSSLRDDADIRMRSTGAMAVSFCSSLIRPFARACWKELRRSAK